MAIAVGMILVLAVMVVKRVLMYLRAAVTIAVGMILVLAVVVVKRVGTVYSQSCSGHCCWHYTRIGRGGCYSQ